MFNLSGRQHERSIRIHHRVGHRIDLVGGRAHPEGITVRSEVIFIEIRQLIRPLFTYGFQYLKVIQIGHIRKPVGHIDAAYVISDKLRHIVAHAPVLEYGDG